MHVIIRVSEYLGHTEKNEWNLELHNVIIFYMIIALVRVLNLHSIQLFNSIDISKDLFKFKQFTEHFN